MNKLKILFPIIALVVLLSAIVGCGGLPGGAPPSSTAAPAAPTTGAAAPPSAPTAVAGAPTAVAAAPTVPFAATATVPVVAATDAPARISPTPPPAGTPDPSTLAASAGPICDKAFSGPVPPAPNADAPVSPILTMLNKEYEGRTWVYNPVTTIKYATDARTVRSVLCIVETRKMTDKYPDGSPVYQVTWEARFLRWPEGNILRSRAGMLGSQIFTTFPKPAGNEFYGGRPDNQLIDFVKESLGS